MASSITSRRAARAWIVRQYRLCGAQELISRSPPEAGELCTEWKSWSAFLNVRMIGAQAILQSTIYVALAVCASYLRPKLLLTQTQIVFAASAAILVQSYAP